MLISSMNQSKSSLGNLVNIFIDTLHINNFSKDTIKTYTNCLGKFVDYITQNNYDFKNRMHIKSFLSYIYMRVERKTYEKYVAVLRSFYNFLFDDGYIESNPLKIKLKWSGRVLKEIPHEDTIKKIFDTSGEDRIIFLVLYGCGLRIKEAEKLKAGDFNFFDGTLRVMGKGGSERIVPVPDKIMGEVMDYIRKKNLKSTDSLFISKKGGRLTQWGIRKRVKKIMKKLNLSFTPHHFRHAYATHLLKKGAPIRAVQELLGHKSISSTQVYTKVEIEKILKEYRKAF